MLYQLRYYARGQESNVRCESQTERTDAFGRWFQDPVCVSQISSHEMTSGSLNCNVRDEILIPGAEYGAQVRASPNQASYCGQWSDWSSEIHWKTEPAGHGKSSAEAVKRGFGYRSRASFAFAAVTSAPLLSGLRQEFFLGAMVLLLLLPVACVIM